MTKVIWEEIDKDGKESSYSYICFSEISRSQSPHQIRYHAHVDNSLTPEQVKCWVESLGKWLDPNNFTYDLKSGEVTFMLFSGGMKWAETMLYLTAFRYVDEFAPVVIEFHLKASKLTGAEDIFRAMQKANGENEHKVGNMSGHGLISRYAGASGSIITLERFRSLIGVSTSVGGHFK